MAGSSEVIVNYKKIVDSLREELLDVWNALRTLDVNDVSHPEYKEIVDIISVIEKIEVADEQNFMRYKKNKTLRENTVYAIVKFGGGAINYASSALPLSIYCMGTANKVKPVQVLLGTFASAWTTKNLSQGLDDEDPTALQVWNTPEVVSSFNEVYADFKNLYRVSGNIVIGPEAIRVGELVYIFNPTTCNYPTIPAVGWESMNIMSYQDNYHASLDSQPFGNTHGFAKSEVNFSTHTFSIATYLLNGQLAKDMLAVRGFRYRPNGTYDNATSTFYPNKPVKIMIKFNNGYTNVPGAGETADATLDPIKGSDFFSWFKVVDSNIDQKLGEIPSLVVTFTR